MTKFKRTKSKPNLNSSSSKSTSLRTAPSEKQIETAILQCLKYLPGCKAWKNHSVGIYDPNKKTFRTRSRFHIKGVSDILGIYKGRMLCFEVKSPKGRLSEDQTIFLQQMHELGAIAGVVRSVDDALALLEIAESPIRFH